MQCPGQGSNPNCCWMSNLSPNRLSCNKIQSTFSFHFKIPVANNLSNNNLEGAKLAAFSLFDIWRLFLSSIDGGMTALKNSAWAEPRVNKSPLEKNLRYCPDILGDIPKTISNFPNYFASPKKVSRLPAKSWDSWKNFVFLLKQPFLKLTPPVQQGQGFKPHQHLETHISVKCPHPLPPEVSSLVPRPISPERVQGAWNQAW